MAESVEKLHYQAILGQEKRRLTRARIIETAIPVFAEYGPDVPVIDDFIKAASVSRGTFYNHFATSHALLQATIEKLSDEIVAAIVPAVADITNPVLRFATASHVFFRRAAADPVLRRFITAVTSTRASLTEEIIRRDLKQSIEENLIPAQSIEIAYAVAVGVINAALHQISSRGSLAIPSDQVVRAMLRGLGVAPHLIDAALKIEVEGFLYGGDPAV